MTEYTIDDIKVLEEDSKPDDPKAFTPKFELPGELYNQSYPKRLRHTFPENDKWTKKVELNDKEVPRWKKYIYDHYL